MVRRLRALADRVAHGVAVEPGCRSGVVGAADCNPGCLSVGVVGGGMLFPGCVATAGRFIAADGRFIAADAAAGRFIVQGAAAGRFIAADGIGLCC